MMSRKGFLFILLFFLLVNFGLARIIYLKSGRVIEGEVLSFDGNSLKVNIPKIGIIIIHSDRVLKIVPPIDGFLAKKSESGKIEIKVDKKADIKTEKKMGKPKVVVKKDAFQAVIREKEEIKKPVTKEKKETGKMEIELSIGAGLPSLKQLKYSFSRPEQVRDLIYNYYQSRGYEFDFISKEGNLETMKILFPINLNINFPLSKNLFLKVGGEFAFVKSKPNIILNYEWYGKPDVFDYSFDFSTSYILPYIGFEYRSDSFGFYANAGYGLASFKLNHLETNSYNNSWEYDSQSEFEGSGNGLAFIVGAKIGFGKGGPIFIKVEYMYFKTAQLEGSSQYNYNNDSGDYDYEHKSGKFYSYEYEYLNGSLDSWYIFESSPTGNKYRNVKEMVLNFSGIRIMISFAFTVF